MINQATCLRDKVILSFYSDTGARASELLAPRVKDFDLHQRLVMIPHLKHGIKKICPRCQRTAGRSTRFCSKCGQDLSKVEALGIQKRNRLIGFSQTTADLIREYVKGMDPEEPLIDLSRQAIYYIVRDAAERAGLGGKAILNPETGKMHYVHPHNFRDSLAVGWLTFSEGDANKQKALQDHLGHQSFDTTMRYNKLTPSTVQDVSEQVRQARFEPKKTAGK